jgi:FAD synthetase
MIPVAGPMQHGIHQYMRHQPHIQAIFIGTRRTDPWAQHLNSFERCDVEKGWPDLMRINPILDWKFADIWLFLNTLGIEYCPLYDLGYTSLGSKSSTVPNPDLGIPETHPTQYYPAWKLQEDANERKGRNVLPTA